MIRPLVVLAALGHLALGGSQAHAAGKQAPARVEAKVAAKKGSTARSTPSVGTRIAARATRLVGVSSLRKVDRSVPDDCTGVARIAYSSVGIEVMPRSGVQGDNGVSNIHRHAKQLGAVHKGKPKPGDLVFFRETYDRNRDGRRNDGLTHVGVVERIEPNGTILFVHRGSKGVARVRMNLQRPTTRRDTKSGAVLNDYLRAASGKSRAYLTGELFAGFASPGPLAKARAVVSARR
ncbi:CHAP domain-containing protein [Hyalangium rubrum]|uniref:CHAP domain-containing protein n=1 Tax=Hyalangium rubrum TaxID=3103134 RepID=A0ABU5GXE6_9BACT|nr:CHAP domain-containing protein [Hyalangium sp. s54d21]MDY7225863.1 CHAP domain-containing protein [Hyalangium sp. s54d21]